jgi:hypothetical protein
LPRRLFALDHNFPQPLLAALAGALPQVELVPIHDIAPSFADLDDWQLLRALHVHERDWDGLITNDDAMLSLAKEMTVLSQTGLTLVVAKGEGHNPIRAVGTLLCHLSYVCHHTVPGTAQIWRLRVAQKNAEPVGSRSFRRFVNELPLGTPTGISLSLEGCIPDGQLIYITSHWLANHPGNQARTSQALTSAGRSTSSRPRCSTSPSPISIPFRARSRSSAARRLVSS